MDNYLQIQKFMTEKGISGKSLSDQLKITPNSVSLIINGKRQPRFETLKQIADILEVDIRELFTPTKTKETKEVELFTKGNDGQFERFGTLVTE